MLHRKDTTQNCMHTHKHNASTYRGHLLYYIYVHVYVYVYVYIYTYIYIQIYMYTCICIFFGVYINIFRILIEYIYT